MTKAGRAPVTTRQVKRCMSAHRPLPISCRGWNTTRRADLSAGGRDQCRCPVRTDPGRYRGAHPGIHDPLRDAIQTALTDAIPEEDDAPWILQVYVQDEPSLQGFQKEVANYAQPSAKIRPTPGTFSRCCRTILARSRARAVCLRIPPSPAPVGGARSGACGQRCTGG